MLGYTTEAVFNVKILLPAVTLKFIDNYVNNELYLGLESVYRNTTIKNCTWHNTYDDNCSKDVSLILYVDNKREVVSKFGSCMRNCGDIKHISRLHACTICNC